MLKNFQSRLWLGKDWYHTYQKKITLTANITVKNKLLYRELEKKSKPNGILTYAEYLQIDQFGTSGYYANSTLHGKTDVDERWGLALAKYCQKNNHDTIIEFGCGTGDLGVETIKAFKKISKNKLNWIGVDLDKNIHKLIFETFKRNNVLESIEVVATTIDEIPQKKNALIVFPYSLDNIPPHVFLNTKQTDSYPDTLLGIKIDHGMISEMIIPQDILQKKGIKFNNGMFTQNGFIFNLTKWKLRTGQRAYIATDAFATVYAYGKKFPNATIVIIDEFRKEPWDFSLGNLGTPKSLYEKNLPLNERTRYYKESGTHNLYYPLFKESLFKFLGIVGFRSILFDIEQKIATELSEKRWHQLGKSYTTYAFIAKNSLDKKLHSLPIPSPQRKIF